MMSEPEPGPTHSSLLLRIQDASDLKPSISVMSPLASSEIPHRMTRIRVVGSGRTGSRYTERLSQHLARCRTRPTVRSERSSR
jgi:hypothetical protein